MHVGHLLVSCRQTIYKVLLHTTCVTFCVLGCWSESATVRVLETSKQENFGTKWYYKLKPEEEGTEREERGKTTVTNRVWGVEGGRGIGAL